MNDPRREEVLRLKLEGLSYAKIAKRFGFTRQRAQQLAKPTPEALKAAKDRADGQCESCGKKKLLHGHHPDYSDPESVIMLCTSCHMKLKSKWNPEDDSSLIFPPTLEDQIPTREAAQLLGVQMGTIYVSMSKMVGYVVYISASLWYFHAQRSWLTVTIEINAAWADRRSRNGNETCLSRDGHTGDAHRFAVCYRRDHGIS